jgi:hypothetical protein
LPQSYLYPAESKILCHLQYQIKWISAHYVVLSCPCEVEISLQALVPLLTFGVMRPEPILICQLVGPLRSPYSSGRLCSDRRLPLHVQVLDVRYDGNIGLPDHRQKLPLRTQHARELNIILRNTDILAEIPGRRRKD